MTEVHPAGNVFQVGNGMQRSFRHDGANANAMPGVASLMAAPPSDWTLAILNRQEGGMSFKIAELFQRSCYRRRTCHATPARSDHTDIGTLCATLFAPGLVPCAIIASGSDLDSWCAHRDSRLAGDGAGHGTSLHELPSGVEPDHLVGPPGQSDSVGVTRRALGASGSPYCPGSR